MGSAGGFEAKVLGVAIALRIPRKHTDSRSLNLFSQDRRNRVSELSSGILKFMGSPKHVSLRTTVRSITGTCTSTHSRWSKALRHSYGTCHTRYMSFSCGYHMATQTLNSIPFKALNFKLSTSIALLVFVFDRFFYGLQLAARMHYWVGLDSVTDA